MHVLLIEDDLDLGPERLGGEVSLGDGLARLGGCGVRFEPRLPAAVLGVS